MLETIPIPAQSKFGAAVARRLNASIPIAPSGTLAMSGPTGTGFAPLPANLRDRRVVSADLHPWKVFAVGKGETVDHFFEIYVPDGSITVGAKEIEVEGISETETPERFTFACEQDVGESSTLYLVVYREDESEEDEKNYKSVLAVNLDQYEDDERVTDVFPIAELSVVNGEEYDKGKVVSQIQKSAIHIGDYDVAVDKVSIDKVTADDAKDKDAIQIKDFDNDKSDGKQGLAQRLRVVKDGEDSFHIEAEDGSEVFLVARVNGKLKYIPLGGSSEKDPDEKQEDPCEHPGDIGEGGVLPDDHPHAVVVPGGGGVPADGDTHAGEPCPACSPTN